MITLAKPAEMRAWSRRQRAGRHRIGLVPTMGFLHEGHLRLVDRARERTEEVVVSIFVNPLQFGPGEDFASYPRDPARDHAALEARGTACLFAPDLSTMYGGTSPIRVEPGALADHLCGPHRPGHFAGVLTVVAKLLHIVEPDVAIFGRKDAQQAILIRRMVTELDFPTEIDVAPTVREADGLALSSRNTYLTPEERRIAPVLARGLEAAHAAFRGGTRDAAGLLDVARRTITAEPAVELEYVEAVDPHDLQTITHATPETIVAVAARLGRARLIDNIVVGEGTAGDPRVHSATASG